MRIRMRIRLLINKLVVILLCCCMAAELTACSSQNGGRQYTVYYTNSSKDKLIEQNYNIDSDTSIEDTARQLLDKMNVKPADKNEYIIKPDNVTLLDVMLDGKAIALNYSSSYKQMSTQVELLFRAAVVKMLTQIDDVLHVHFYVDGKEALYEDGTVIGALKKTDFTESDSAFGEMDWRNVQLYYADYTGTKLVKVKEMLAYNKNMPIERMIVQRLISGPTAAGAYTSLPKDVKLLGVSVVEKVCYVNLSEEFRDELVNVSSYVEIYSIVNSLCALDSIESVKIFINGDYTNTFRDSISLDRLYKFNSGIVE